MANPKGNPDIAKYAPAKGTTRNPAGVSSDTQKLRQQFLSDLQKAWKVRGAVVLEELSPAELVRAVTAIMPKESKVDVAGTVAHEHSAVSAFDRLVCDALGIREAGDVQSGMHH